MAESDCERALRDGLGPFSVSAQALFVAIECSLSSFFLPRRTDAGDVASSNRLVADALKDDRILGGYMSPKNCVACVGLVVDHFTQFGDSKRMI